MVAVVIPDRILMVSGVRDIEKAAPKEEFGGAHLAGPRSRVKGVTSTAS
jgi:hypothetical protein